MLLIGVREENGWLTSRWNLTYRVGWERICRAVYSVYDFYSDVQVLLDGKMMKVNSKEEMLILQESGKLTIRGFSEIVKAPVMITFYNQSNAVDVTVAALTEEFRTADYRKFNMSLGQYMDSIELAMYRN